MNKMARHYCKEMFSSDDKDYNLRSVIRPNRGVLHEINHGMLEHLFRIISYIHNFSKLTRTQQIIKYITFTN